MTKIHYFFDPMCGWCFGASALIQVLAQHASVELVYHPGGMIPKRAIDMSFRQHILQADQQIAALTKVTFGDDYIARVNSSADLILDSYATTQALLAGIELGIDGDTMLRAIQKAHYVDGLEVYKDDVLQQIAVALGLDALAWQDAFAAAKPRMQAEIHHTQQRMQELQIRGYPTLLLETDHEFKRLPHGEFYGQPQAWQRYVDELIA